MRSDALQPAAGMTPATLVVLLSLLMGLQPVTTDLYLPALPGLTAYFGAPMAQAQLTLSGMLLAFGCSQLAGVRSPWAIALPFCLYMLGHGVHQSCGQMSAVAPFPQAAGTAAALGGFLMMLCAFGIGGWVAHRLDGTVFALTNGVWFWSVCVAAVAWTLMRRHGELRAG